MPSTALSMIVRDEARVIERCLRSVLPHVSHVVIFDTGSTDDTKSVIARVLAQHQVPRDRILLRSSPWKDFATNRNEALEAAEDLLGPSGGWVLTIDADEELTPETLVRDEDAAGIYLQIGDADLSCERLALVRAGQGLQWEGVVHEVLAPAPGTQPKLVRLAAPTVISRKEGYRSRDPEAYQKDIALLQAADQSDPRTVYYLGQSLRSAGRLTEALPVLVRRSQMGGWDQEAWHALYTAAQVVEQLGQDPHGAYLQAFQARPGRIEPLVQLARYLSVNQRHALAVVYAAFAAGVSRTSDRLFVENCRWRALDVLATSAFYAGSRQLGAQAMKILLKEGEFPADQAERIAANAKHYEN